MGDLVILYTTMTIERKITQEELGKWRRNTISIAKELDPTFKPLKSRAGMEVIEGDATIYSDIMPLLYGHCAYSPNRTNKQCLIQVYEHNISTKTGEERIQGTREGLVTIGMRDGQIDDILERIKDVSDDKFYEIFNQSGMDHELIGHAYNFLTGQPHGEREAVNVQIIFAGERARKDQDWRIILEVMPTVLGYLKGIEGLK